MPTLSEFNILDTHVIENPYPFYQALLQQAPLYRVPGTDIYLVSSWQLIEEVLRNQKDYSANLTGILVTGADGTAELFDFTAFGGVVDAIANADEPVHSVHRKLVMPQLNARKIDAMEEEIRQWSARRVGALVERGAGDWIEEVADPIPVLAMARLIGLPLVDLPQLLDWAFSGGAILAGTTTLDQLLALSVSTEAMNTYLQKHMQGALAERPEPVSAPNDLTEELVNGVRSGLISEREAVSILVVLVGAAGESTSSLTGSAVRVLAEDALLQQKLRKSPDLIPNFVEEIVRLESPFKGHYRAVLHPTRLNGIELTESARVFLLWSAANRDPGAFSEPNELQLDRAKPRDHLGFGRGIHFCVGARLARMEAIVIIEELLSASSTFFVTPNTRPEYVPSIFVRRLRRLPLTFSR
ncbi:cytochrome P450 [Halioglobus maricola]|nr:cytochrome P450 [Halioglobus maricola]